ncbi:MAG: hypothetical protein ABIJ72_02885 [bacterium]
MKAIVEAERHRHREAISSVLASEVERIAEFELVDKEQRSVTKFGVAAAIEELAKAIHPFLKENHLPAEVTIYRGGLVWQISPSFLSRHLGCGSTRMSQASTRINDALRALEIRLPPLVSDEGGLMLLQEAHDASLEGLGLTWAMMKSLAKAGDPT